MHDGNLHPTENFFHPKPNLLEGTVPSTCLCKFHLHQANREAHLHNHSVVLTATMPPLNQCHLEAPTSLPSTTHQHRKTLCPTHSRSHTMTEIATKLGRKPHRSTARHSHRPLHPHLVILQPPNYPRSPRQHSGKNLAPLRPSIISRPCESSTRVGRPFLVRFWCTFSMQCKCGAFLTFSQATEALPTSPPPHLPALSFETNHKRGESDASSIYSENRLSTFSTYLANQKRATRSSLAAPNDSNYYGYPSMDGTITSSTESKEGDRKPGHASTFLTPSAAQGNGSRLSVQPSSNESRLSVMPQGNESRLSEFYDAYYRNSQIAPLPPVEVKRTHNERQSTIMEVDTPMASPMLLKPVAYQPGVAM